MATQKQLMDAITKSEENGWIVRRTPYGFDVTRTTERPTPKNIPPEWWPCKTYSRIYSLNVVMKGSRVVSVMQRVHVSPWTRATEFRASNDSAITFLRSESTQ